MSRVENLNSERYFELVRSANPLDFDDPIAEARRSLETQFPGLHLKLSDDAYLEKLRAELVAWKREGITVIPYGVSHYPKPLYQIHDPPLILFARGNLDLLIDERPRLAVIGSRKADSFGCEFSELASYDLANGGAVIVSGLALGIDQAAHEGALRSNIPGSTIAILGSGLNQFYPPQNKKLADKILLAGGTILSQFEPTMKPLPYNFLNRNRIISGLSQAVLVIQAPQKSGSLSTARHALEQGKDVLIIPGNINDPRYTGSNRLIQQGAYLITSVADVREFFPGLSPAMHQANEGELVVEDVTQRKVLEILKEERSLHYEVIISRAGERGQVSMALTELELVGRIRREPGNYYRLKGL